MSHPKDLADADTPYSASKGTDLDLMGQLPEIGGADTFVDASEKELSKLSSAVSGDLVVAGGGGLQGASRWWSALLRFGVFILATAPILLLGVTRLLQPDAAGLGTHQQLGLPPCSMRLMVGFRCPACGMTTSWAHFTRGDWLGSVQANAGGFLLALLVVGAAPVLLRWSWTGAAPRYQVQNRLIFAVLAITGVTICDWMARIWAFS